MKFRGTLIALVVAAVFAAYLFYSERESEQRAVQREGLSKLVKGDDIESMSFAFSGKRIAVQRRGDVWVLTYPVSAPCDPQRIATVIDTLRAARIENRVGSGNLLRYGLDHPAADVNIQFTDGSTTRLRFGRLNPLQTLVYALIDDSDEVVLTTSSLLTFSLTSEFGWRDKRMIQADPDEIFRMRFRAGDAGSLIVDRTARGWVVKNRKPWRVDPLKAENVLRVLASLSAAGVAAESKEDLDKHGLGSRRVSAILEGRDGDVLGDVVYGFARTEGTYYAIVPDKPEIFLVEGEAATSFVSFARSFRDHKVFPAFEAAEVTKLDVSSPTDSFRVERRSRDRWVVTQSTKHDSSLVIDPRLVMQMLEDLMTMRVVEFPKEQPEASVVEPPQWRINLSGEQGWLSGVDVGRRDPHGLHTFVRGTHDEWWVLVSVTTLIGMPFDLERLQAGEVEMPESSSPG